MSSGNKTRIILAILSLSWATQASAAFSRDEVLSRADECADALVAIRATKGMDNRPKLVDPQIMKLERAFLVCLQKYIQLPTVNPPGSEWMAADFFEHVFSRLAIPVRRIDTAPGRPIVVASLYPSDRGPDRPGPSILLYNHTDVVDAFPEQWVDPSLPFSGKIAPHPMEKTGTEYIWGRGALDMKSTGIMQLISMAILKQSGISLNRALHFIASPDEENQGSGGVTTLREMRPGGALQDLGQAEVLLNEGGSGLVQNGYPVFLIGTEEKGGAWMRARHKTPLKLLSFLAGKLKLVSEVPAIDMNPGPSPCRLAHFQTPGAKVNISPSKAEITLDCPAGPGHPSLKEVEEAFHAEHAKTEVRAEGPLYRVQLTLPSSGHGSQGEVSILTFAVRGLMRMKILQESSGPGEDRPSFYHYQFTPATEDAIRSLAPAFSIPAGAVDFFAHFLGLKQILLELVGDLVYSEALFRTSCAWTGFDLENGEASALIDCRLLHTSYLKPSPKLHGEAFVNQLKEQANDPALDLELLTGWNHTSSPIDSRAMKIMKKTLKARYTNAIISSYPFPASSDNTYFRAPQTVGSELAPIPSYGYSPFILTNEVLQTFHGSDERLPVDQALEGALIYLETVTRLATDSD